MNKQELTDEMSAALGITKKCCGETIGLMVEEIISAVERDGKYVQPGFGTFRTAVSGERIGVNPATGQKMRYPKKRKLKFKVSSVLKDEIK